MNMKANRVPTTVRLGRIDARPSGRAQLDRTIAVCRAALDDSETGGRSEEEVRKYLGELLELREGRKAANETVCPHGLRG